MEKYLHGLFPLWGIRFVGAVDHADTGMQGNKKSRQINGLVNEWYLEDLSDNIRSVLDNRRKSGLHIGASALYGYRKDPERKGHLVIDADAAAVVLDIFTLYASGYGKTAVARMLNERGTPSPLAYRQQDTEAKTVTLWRYDTISRILNNEMYIGHMIQGRYGSVSWKTKENRPRPREMWFRVENTHPAIVPRDLWERVQGLLRQRSHPFSGGSIGPFAGKARCLYCGYRLRSSKNRGRHYLKCTTRHIGGSCPGAFVSVDLLEQTVLAELERLTTEHLDSDCVTAELREPQDSAERITGLRKGLAEYTRKLEEYRIGLRELYLDKAKGVISESEYLDFSGHFASECRRLEAEMEQLRSRIAGLESADCRSARDPTAQIRSLLESGHLTREMSDIMLDSVQVGRRDPDSGVLPIELHWNF